MNLEISHTELLVHLQKRAAFYRRELNGMVGADVIKPNRKKAYWFAEVAKRLKPAQGGHILSLAEFEALELGVLEE